MNLNTFAHGLEWKRSLQTADAMGPQAFFAVVMSTVVLGGIVAASKWLRCPIGSG